MNITWTVEYAVLCLTCVVLCGARHAIDLADHPARQFTCVYKNQVYHAGIKFEPDICTTCQCPKEGGRPRCVIEDCKHDLDCVQFMTTSQSKCCDICVERGCMDFEGNLHQPGDIVSKTSCTTCRCPVDGGQIECSHVACPKAPCLDPVVEDGACCQTCPNGVNCRLGSIKLMAGQVVRKGPCKTCRCPDKLHSRWFRRRGPKAICTIGNCW